MWIADYKNRYRRRAHYLCTILEPPEDGDHLASFTQAHACLCKYVIRTDIHKQKSKSHRQRCSRCVKLVGVFEDLVTKHLLLIGPVQSDYILRGEDSYNILEFWRDYARDYYNLSDKFTNLFAFRQTLYHFYRKLKERSMDK